MCWPSFPTCILSYVCVSNSPTNLRKLSFIMYNVIQLPTLGCLQMLKVRGKYMHNSSKTLNKAQMWTSESPHTVYQRGEYRIETSRLHSFVFILRINLKHEERSLNLPIVIKSLVMLYVPQPPPDKKYSLPQDDLSHYKVAAAQVLHLHFMERLSPWPLSFSTTSFSMSGSEPPDCHKHSYALSKLAGEQREVRVNDYLCSCQGSICT